jgi:hypothetical protein
MAQVVDTYIASINPWVQTPVLPKNKNKNTHVKSKNEIIWQMYKLVVRIFKFWYWTILRT